MPNKIEIKRNYSDLRIFINDALHLHIKMDEYLGMQSWCDGYNCKKQVIRYYFKTTRITTEYERKEDWLEILRQLNEFL